MVLHATYTSTKGQTLFFHLKQLSLQNINLVKKSTVNGHRSKIIQLATTLWYELCHAVVQINKKCDGSVHHVVVKRLPHREDTGNSKIPLSP